MHKDLTPEDLALDISSRSICNVQMGAVLADKHGIFSWGWNHTSLWAPPNQRGESIHAEVHAIRRANPKRMRGATIYIAGVRKSSGNTVEANPCPDCFVLIKAVGIKKIVYLDKNKWERRSV